MNHRIDRILWNRRPRHERDMGDIDEIVVHDCTVHIEQMGDEEWSVVVMKGETQWSGSFYSPHGAASFGQVDGGGMTWDRDDSHEEAK